MNESNVDIFAWGSCQYQDAVTNYTYWMQLSLNDMHNELALLGKGIPTELTILDVEAFKRDQVNDAIEMEMPIDEIYDTTQRLKSVTDVTSMLHFLRDSAWDLWSAISEAVVRVFPDWDFDCDEETGLACAMLQRYGYVKDIEPFTDFDT